LQYPAGLYNLSKKTLKYSTFVSLPAVSYFHCPPFVINVSTSNGARDFTGTSVSGSSFAFARSKWITEIAGFYCFAILLDDTNCDRWDNDIENGVI